MSTVKTQDFEEVMDRISGDANWDCWTKLGLLYEFLAEAAPHHKESLLADYIIFLRDKYQEDIDNSGCDE